MDIIAYPETGYNSWVTEDAADEYYDGRLNASAWDTCDTEAALLTSFQSLQELTITIDPTDSAQLEILKKAQLEQVLHLLVTDVDGPALAALSFGGMVSVKLQKDQSAPARHSNRVFALLQPYMSMNVMTRTR